MSDIEKPLNTLRRCKGDTKPHIRGWLVKGFPMRLKRCAITELVRLSLPQGENRKGL